MRIEEEQIKRITYEQKKLMLDLLYQGVPFMWNKYRWEFTTNIITQDPEFVVHGYIKTVKLFKGILAIQGASADQSRNIVKVNACGFLDNEYRYLQIPVEEFQFVYQIKLPSAQEIRQMMLKDRKNLTATEGDIDQDFSNNI